MFKNIVNTPSRLGVTKDEKGRVEIVNVDNSRSGEMYTNNHGWIKNDIKLYNDAQSEMERQLVLQRLEYLKTTSNDFTKNMTDEEIIKYAIPPRSMMSPSDYVDYQMHSYEYLDSKNAETKKADSESNISFAENKQSSESV